MLNGEVVDTFTYDGTDTGSFTGTVVPEPMTIGMLGIGSLILILIRRTRLA